MCSRLLLDVKRSYTIFCVDISSFPIKGLTFGKSKINFVIHDG